MSVLAVEESSLVDEIAGLARAYEESQTLISLLAHELRTRLKVTERALSSAAYDGVATALENTRTVQAISESLLELARGAAAELGEDRVVVVGEGREVEVDVDATKRGVAALAQAALRHGGLEQVDLRVSGATLAISPVTASSGLVLVGEELRDLGAAVAVRLVRALGGSVELDGDSLVIRFAE